ncbi:MAG TPA: glucose-6-phosphate dehydrogenase assembly protein OpcA [Mycobacteriales bacterium]|nr:glucose-6-phosphate dehydrogenase assembly protein OpcA [Mycobacteriales bacterium]
MTTLWDTTGTDVVKALAAERRTGGAVTSGCALTLIVVVNEHDVAGAEEAATMAASHHPCRLLIVVRREIDAPVPRLDAEVLIGGRLGPGEAVVMRMYGRLALHAESVTLPLLAPDVPVVTWWHGEPPDAIAHDPLGVFADRRISDVSRASDPAAALRRRGEDYAPGDTDLAWTRITPWRSQLASAVDSARAAIEGAVVHGGAADPSTQLLAGWLESRIGRPVPITDAGGPIAQVDLSLAGAPQLSLKAGRYGQGQLDRGNGPSAVPMPERSLGELLAEELHRLDDDQPYAEALGVAVGMSGLNNRPDNRTHIWRDPAQPAAS